MRSGGDDGDAIDRYGTPGGPLVVLLHGAVANRKSWLPVVAALPPVCEVWCPDLPGHGAWRDEPFGLARAIDETSGLIATAGPRGAVLAGDSLGGYVALAVAARRSPALRAVVAGGCTWSMTGVGGRLARFSDVVPALVERALGTERAERFAASLVPRMTDAATARAIVETGLRLGTRGESLRELAGMDLVRIVREIAVPVTFVNGRYDWPTRAGERTLLGAARSGSLFVSRRCGHGVGIFDPPTFAAAIVAAMDAARAATVQTPRLRAR